MDITISAGFSNRPYDLRMRVYTIENNVGANYSRYRGDRYAYSRSGYGSYRNDAAPLNSWIAGYFGGGSYSLPFAPGDYAGKVIGLGSFDTGGVGHDGNGYMNTTARIQMNPGSPFGSADTGDVWFSGDRLPRPPGAPNVIGIDEVTSTSFRYRFSSTSDGGSALTSHQVQISTSPSFSTFEIQDSPGTTVFTGRTPGVTYYVRSRSNNAYWNGAWSATVSQTTIPAVAPGISVAPSLSGTVATVTLSPPGGATGVTKYTIERRRNGVTVGSSETTTTQRVFTGLTPGATYEWRAKAWFGTYESPWSPWLAATQPNTNTNPGDYFDGDTPSRDDIDFTWDSTVGLSTSTGMGTNVRGWEEFFAAGATGGLQRVTGGLAGAGSFSARLFFTDAATAPGSGVQTIASTGNWIDVEEATDYGVSAYVRPSRAQRLRVEGVWYDAAGSEIGTTPGAETIVTNTATATRLTVIGTAPLGAAHLGVRVLDVAGTGWVAWQSGDSMLIDAAMASVGAVYAYFDGSTPTDPVNGFDYIWLGPANNSASRRDDIPVDLSDPLLDPDCPAPPAPPTLPTIDTECIDEVGEWRQYAIAIQPQEVALWSATIPTLGVTTGAVAERQVRIRYYPNPDGLTPGAVVGGRDWEAEMILTYVPPLTTVTLDGLTQRATAEVAGRAPVPADKLLYGTGGQPATWPVMRCGVGYIITLDVPIEAPSGNLSTTVILTERV